MIKAYLRHDNVIRLDASLSSGLEYSNDVVLVGPADLERSTGTLRSPQAAFDLPAEIVARLSFEDDRLVSEPVIGLMVHKVSCRATAVGAFDTTSSALSWWNQPYNRFARNADLLFLLVPVIGDVNGATP